MEKNMERNLLLLIPMALLALFMLFGNALLSNTLLPIPAAKNQLVTTCLPESHTSGGIGYSLTADGDRVGLSDGLIPFDLQSNERQDQSDKIRASDLFAQNDATAGVEEWRVAIRQDPTDAEIHIYEEDQSILSSGLPCATLVVGVALTGSLREGGRAVLQGAYLAQKEHNDDMRQRGSGTLLRLLIANNGSDNASMQMVVQRIVKVAKSDRSFVGVMGWDYSTGTALAAHVLGL